MAKKLPAKAAKKITVKKAAKPAKKAAAMPAKKAVKAAARPAPKAMKPAAKVVTRAVKPAAKAVKQALKASPAKQSSVNWPEALQPLLKKYKGKQHPLDYKNIYQLMVMVILSARDSDKHINSLAPALFGAFPSMAVLAEANTAALHPYIAKVSNSANKSKWLIDLAKAIKTDKNIPLTMESLTQLQGVGRKSANVIMREAGAKPEGVMVDLHVLRVAPRLGIATGTDPKKIELQIMDAMPQKDWGETGMAISFLGRETCRPSNPKHAECPVNQSCAYFKSLMKK